MRKTIGLMALAVLCASQARAAGVSMDVAPTTLEIRQGAVDLFYVANHGASPVTVQIEGFDWRQPEGAPDALSPSAHLMVSPPMATIAPGARQLVRVLAAPTGDAAEDSYRLVVSQLSDNTPVDGNAVRILLRFGVPVFAGEGAQTPQLSWSAAPRAGGLDLAVRNDGTHAVKLAAPRVAQGAAPVAAADGTSFVYVLPGATRHFAFHGVPAGAALHVAARDLRSEKDVAADIVARP